MPQKLVRDFPRFRGETKRENSLLGPIKLRVQEQKMFFFSCCCFRNLV